MTTLIEFFKENHEQSRYLNWDLPIQVCHSAGGYYIGQMEDGSPHSRLSTQYFATREDAETALKTGTFTPKLWL